MKKRIQVMQPGAGAWQWRGVRRGRGQVRPGDSLGHCICWKCLAGLSPVGEVAECIGFYKEPWGSGRAEGNLATS